MDSTGRVAVVTGGGRGIGAGVARRMAADGRPVGIVDLHEDDCRETVEAIRRLGGSVVVAAADVSDEDQVGRAVERIVDELGPPTILVNNAGITRDNLLFKMTVADWDDVMAVHLRGAFLMTRAVQRHMVDAGWGRIVCLSSVSARGNRGQANYSSAKAGLQGFAKTVAWELGRYGVTSNCIAPGFIETEMTRATAARMGMAFEDFKAAGAAQSAVRRVGSPEDVAGLVSYLVSDEAGYVTGQVIDLAGTP